VVVVQRFFVTNLIAFDEWNLITVDIQTFDISLGLLAITLFITFSLSMRDTMEHICSHTMLTLVSLMLNFILKLPLPSLYSHAFCTNICLEKINHPRFLLDFINVQKRSKKLMEYIIIPEKKFDISQI